MQRPLWEINAFYAPRMHLYRQEVTSYFEHAFASVLVKMSVFRGIFIHAYYFVCTQKFFPGCNIYYSRVTTHTVSLYTPCYLGKYVFSLSEQPSCKYFRISVVFVYGVNYKLLQLKTYDIHKISTYERLYLIVKWL